MEVAWVDRVAGAVDEVVTVAQFGYHRPSGVVHLSTPNGLTPLDAFPQQRDGSIPRIPHRLPDSTVALTRSAKRAHPGLISEHSVFFTRPQVDEKDVGAIDRRGALCGRLIVRIRGIGTNRHDRPVIGLQAAAVEPLTDPPLERVFGHRRRAVGATAGEADRLLPDDRDGARSPLMGCALDVAPYGVKAGTQLRGRDDRCARGS